MTGRGGCRPTVSASGLGPAGRTPAASRRHSVIHKPPPRRENGRHALQPRRAGDSVACCEQRGRPASPLWRLAGPLGRSSASARVAGAAQAQASPDRAPCHCGRLPGRQAGSAVIRSLTATRGRPGSARGELAWPQQTTDPRIRWTSSWPRSPLRREGPCIPTPGRAVRCVVLRDTHGDRGSRLEAAQLEDDGTLRITGRDHGPGVSEFFDEQIRSYEWVRWSPPTGSATSCGS